jgi:O-antigen/teichoic acid export membrane protein
MVTGTALVSTNRQKLGLNLTIAAVAVNISLNVLLIPKTATWVHRLQQWSRKPLRERAAYFRFSYRWGFFSTIAFRKYHIDADNNHRPRFLRCSYIQIRNK